MKHSGKIAFLALFAAASLAGSAYGGARPVVEGLYSISLFDAKTSVGSDGLFRVLFDYSPALVGSSSTYSGSALWIIDPNGTLVAAGSPTIPASVGSSFPHTTILGKPVFPYERSNTALFAQPDGNTTVLFYYALSAGNGTQIATWTYNSSGALIAASVYGPFSGVVIPGAYFDPSGKTIVRWRVGGPSSALYAAWVLDEFGNIASATNYYGPFAPTLGRIRLNSKGQQIWPFTFANSNGTFLTNIWTFNPSGSALVNAQSFGPF
jgi:hypothetical protein